MEVPAGFDEAYVALFARAERVAGRILADAADAEDVAAETLSRALVRWHRIDGFPEAWVTRVATNLAIDRVRRRPPGPERRVEPAFEDELSTRLDLSAALRTLAPRQRQALALHYLVGLPDDEVAAVLGVRTATVKTHLHRGLEALRRRQATTPEEVP